VSGPGTGFHSACAGIRSNGKRATNTDGFMQKEIPFGATLEVLWTLE
jgi:hypothetical protein